MPYRAGYQPKPIPFLLGLTVPARWALQNDAVRPQGAATALAERAVALGFDFLLAPRSLATVYRPAGAPPCALHGPDRSAASDGVGDDDQRDLVWLQRPLLAAEGGVIVSSTDSALDRAHALFLRDRIAAVRAAGEGGEDRCVLLEIGVDGLVGSGDGWDVADDEDDVLENFVISLGRTRPGHGRNPTPCAAAPATDAEKLHRFLLLLHETGCDGASLVLPDPLRDLETFGHYALRRGITA